MNKSFAYGLRDGAATAGILGCFGAVVAGGVTALFAGPVALAAAIGAAVFGVFGAAGSALGAATSGTGNWKASWVGGLPATALLAFGTYTAADSLITQRTSPMPPAALSVSFNPKSTRALDLDDSLLAIVKAIAPTAGEAKAATKKLNPPSFV